jgi:hypothetical protein
MCAVRGAGMVVLYQRWWVMSTTGTKNIEKYFLILWIMVLNRIP